MKRKRKKMKASRKEQAEKREALYCAIVDFIRRNGYSPSVRELKAIVGFGSTQTVHWYLRILRASGRIKYNDRQSRTITISK